MNSPKIIFTDIGMDSPDIETGILSQAGLEFSLAQCRSESEVIAGCAGAEILINMHVPISAEVFRALPELKLIVRYGVGVDNIDLAAAREHGVTVCNVPDYGTAEVADHACAMLLAMLRRLPYMDAATKQGLWRHSSVRPITRLSEMTVGIIGFGRIGRALAERLRPFGFKLIAFDRHLEPGQPAQCGYVTGASLEELVETADAISIHCPPLRGAYLIDAGALAKMKPGVYIVNVARGGIIDEAALDAALENGQVAGAAIDCFGTEPLSADCPLLRHSNVIATPHMAWYSEQANLDLKRKVAEQVVKFVSSGLVDYPIEGK